MIVQDSRKNRVRMKRGYICDPSLYEFLSLIGDYENENNVDGSLTTVMVVTPPRKVRMVQCPERPSKN
jgi:hypothetical protein